MAYSIKLTLITITLLFCSHIAANADDIDSSGIENVRWSKSAYSNMEKLCKVWGIMKYFHPAVTQSDTDMDKELFSVMPQLIEAKENSNAILLEWINHFGVKLNGSMEETLAEILSSGNNFPGKYLSCQVFTGAPIFTNEKIYMKMKDNDDGMRMLALFRYWNIINYFYPYKHLLNDWDGVLHKYVPIFATARTKREYQKAILGLCHEIKDSHAVTTDGTENIKLGDYSPLHIAYFGGRSALNNLVFIGDTLVVKGTKPLKNGETEELPIQRGDIILSVNCRKIKNIISERLPLMPSSNKEAGLVKLSETILCTDDSVIDITYLHNKKKQRCMLKTYPLKDIDFIANPKEKEANYFIKDSIVYINPASWQNIYFNHAWSQIALSKGIIIDLREYPNEFLIDSFGKKLYPDTTHVVNVRVMDSRCLGSFKEFAGLKLHGDSSNYKGHVVLLANEQSISQSEYTIMAFRKAPKAVVMGTHTAGADGDVATITLPGCIYTYISGIEILYPDGGQTQQIGLSPDIEVKPTVESIAKGKDILLEKAIGYIKEHGSTE